MFVCVNIKLHEQTASSIGELHEQRNYLSSNYLLESVLSTEYHVRITIDTFEIRQICKHGE